LGIGRHGAALFRLPPTLQAALYSEIKQKSWQDYPASFCV